MYWCIYSLPYVVEGVGEAAHIKQLVVCNFASPHHHIIDRGSVTHCCNNRLRRNSQFCREDNNYLLGNFLSRHGFSQKLQPPNALLQLPIIREVAKDYDKCFTNMSCTIKNDRQGPLANLPLYPAQLFLMYEGYQLPEIS